MTKRSKNKETTFKHKCFTYNIYFQYEDGEYHGRGERDAKAIWINTFYPKEQQQETLFHEILHIAFTDCALWDKTYDKEAEFEEDIIRYISPSMVQIFQDNPHIADFIFKGKEID